MHVESGDRVLVSAFPRPDFAVAVLEDFGIHFTQKVRVPNVLHSPAARFERFAPFGTDLVPRPAYVLLQIAAERAEDVGEFLLEYFRREAVDFVAGRRQSDQTVVVALFIDSAKEVADLRAFVRRAPAGPFDDDPAHIAAHRQTSFIGSSCRYISFRRCARPSGYHGRRSAEINKSSDSARLPMG